MARQADEGGIPGRIWTEENAARRRPGGAGPDELPGVTTSVGSVMVGLLAALAGMLGYGIGTALQAAGAARARGLAVMRQPMYLVGLGFDAAAWLASLLALQRLPLFAVQALLAGSLCVTVLLARIFLGTRLRRRDGAAVVLVALALAAVAAASGVQSTKPPPGWFTPTALVTLAAVVLVMTGLYRRGRSVPMAVVAGVAFSGSALCARALHAPGGWRQLLTEPVAWAVVGFGVLGAVALSRALERGAVGSAVAVLWVVEVLLPGSVGVLALGDGVRAGWAIPAAAAVAVAVAGCAVLATSPAQPER
jgi:drug/metabolite transporter (DMT)-like permease